MGWKNPDFQKWSFFTCKTQKFEDYSRKIQCCMWLFWRKSWIFGFFQLQNWEKRAFVGDKWAEKIQKRQWICNKTVNLCEILRDKCLKLDFFHVKMGGGWDFVGGNGCLCGTKKRPTLRLVFFTRLMAVWKKGPTLRLVLFIPFYAVYLWVQKKAQPHGWAFYTPKRFWTAVAGMKIPSPRPLDDRGVLCEDKYSFF